MKASTDGALGGHASLGRATLSTRLIFLVSGIGMSAWAPMVPYAKSRLGLDDAQLGLILLVFGGGSMASMPFVGWLSHRYGNRRVIVASGLLLCLALPALALAPSAIALTAALAYFGVMLGVVDVAMNAHAVEVEKLDGRVLMSGFHGLFSVGGLTGAAVMSALLATGLSLAWCAAAVAALLAALVFFLRDGLLPGASEAEGHAAFGIPRGLVLLLGLLCFVSFMAEGSMLDWSAVFLRDFRGFAASSAGIGYACFSIAMALGRLTGDRLVQRVGTVWTVRAGAAIAAAGFALVSTLPWAPASLLGFVLIGLGASNIVPVMFSAAGRLPGTSPAVALATVTMLGYIGLLSGPALIGFLSKISSLPVAMAAVAGLLVVVSASARIVRR